MSAETLAAKAVKLAPALCWGIVPGRRDLLRVVSPTSGREYLLTLTAGGDVRCSCPAGFSGRACYHAAALACDYPTPGDAFRDLTRSAVALPEPVKRARISAKTYSADWE